jgi:hypothetical protein
MLISRAINIENENVNLDSDAPETAPTESACLRASFSVKGDKMEIDEEIIDYFSKSAMDPIHKVDRITDSTILLKVNQLIEKLPLEYYGELMNSSKWKFIYGDKLNDHASKILWLKFNLSKLINESRIKLLNSESSSSRPTPYNLEIFNNWDLDKHSLIDLSIFDNSFQSMIGQGFVFEDIKFSLLQSIGGTNSSYWIAQSIKILLRSGHKIFGRLDPLLFNTSKDFDDIEYRMRVWGRDLDWNVLKGIRTEDHGQWFPDSLSSATILKTDYVWKPLGSEVHFTIEELPKVDFINTRGSRYLHAIYSKDSDYFIHCDGAVRVYDNIEHKHRLNWHLKDNEVRKVGKRIKLFDIKSQLTVGEFVSICANFFIWNEDVIEYLNVA